MFKLSLIRMNSVERTLYLCVNECVSFGIILLLLSDCAAVIGSHFSDLAVSESLDSSLV